jgi:hypothetical protein
VSPAANSVVGRQAGRQASKQASQQASRQTSSLANLPRVAFPLLCAFHARGSDRPPLLATRHGTTQRCARVPLTCRAHITRDVCFALTSTNSSPSRAEPRRAAPRCADLFAGEQSRGRVEKSRARFVTRAANGAKRGRKRARWMMHPGLTRAEDNDRRASLVARRDRCRYARRDRRRLPARLPNERRTLAFRVTLLRASVFRRILFRRIVTGNRAHRIASPFTARDTRRYTRRVAETSLPR